MAHPEAYAMALPKFCNFTDCEEKITTYMYRDQALEIRVIVAILLTNMSPRCLRFNV